MSAWLALLHDSYTFRVVREMVALFRSILPGLAIGLVVSSALTVWWTPLRNARSWKWIGGFWAVLLMAGLGIVSPFCSYLAIPIAAALIVSGVHPAPVFAFLCATPLMNPTLFGMTWSAFGWPMAVARTVSAFGFGVLGGLLAMRFHERLIRYVTQQSPITLHVCNQDKNTEPFIKQWWRSFRHLGWFTLKYVLLGIGIAAVVKEVIPMSWIETAVGRQYGYSVLVGGMLGIPLYVCGGGTIPLIQALMSMGMSQGAALAFFVAGPATKLPTIAALRMTAGTAVTCAYVLLSLAWAVLSGIVFQAVG